MIKYSLILFFFCSAMSLFAQPKDAEIEVKDGKKYYVHFVQAGNTLWGIHSIYNVPLEDIVSSNPGVENGVKEGQKLLIPIAVSTVKPSEIIGETKTYTVLPQETLFGISKKFGVNLEELVEANPGTENGVKVGQVLTIPESDHVVEKLPTNTNVKTSTGKELNVVFSDTIIEHLVLAHETMYSISKRFMVPVADIQKINGLKNTKIKNGDVIKIPIRNEKFQQLEVREIKPIVSRTVDSTLLFKKKDEYSIALLLPFYLDKPEGANKAVSDYATEFYMGAKIAMDSLERLGFKAKLFIYDSKNDSASVKSILNKKEFASMDMVIGPLFPDKMGIVAEWCKKNKVRFVCPVASNAAILKNNQFVYSSVPSDMTLMEGAAKYLLSLNLHLILHINIYLYIY